MHEEAEGIDTSAQPSTQEGGQADVGDMDTPEHSRKVRRHRKRSRGKTIAPRRLTKEEMRLSQTLIKPEVERPRTRADCANGQRPCPWVSCKHHLYLDVNPETGSIKLNFPDLELEDMRDTCSLDVADRGGITLEEVGEILNLTRERIRQVEVRGLVKLKAVSPDGDIGRHLDG
jgi:hypothetical protein